MSSVVDEIREEVEEEALARGRDEGRAEGLARGRAENQRATALQLMRMGRFTFEDIAEITRLGLDEIRAIAESEAR